MCVYAEDVVTVFRQLIVCIEIIQCHYCASYLTWCFSHCSLVKEYHQQFLTQHIEIKWKKRCSFFYSNVRLNFDDWPVQMITLRYYISIYNASFYSIRLQSDGKSKIDAIFHLFILFCNLQMFYKFIESIWPTLSKLL